MRILGAEKLTGRRWAAGTYSGGNFTEGAESAISFRGAVDPAGARALEALDEGLRTSEVLVIRTTFALRTADDKAKTPADEVELESQETGQPETFKVVKVKRWRGRRAHYEAMVARQ